MKQCNIVTPGMSLIQFVVHVVFCESPWWLDLCWRYSYYRRFYYSQSHRFGNISFDARIPRILLVILSPMGQLARVLFDFLHRHRNQRGRYQPLSWSWVQRFQGWTVPQVFDAVIPGCFYVDKDVSVKEDNTSHLYIWRQKNKKNEKVWVSERVSYTFDVNVCRMIPFQPLNRSDVKRIIGRRPIILWYLLWHGSDKYIYLPIYKCSH